MGVYSGVEIVNIYALANDDGDVKMSYYSTFPAKLKGFSLIMHGEMLHWFYWQLQWLGSVHAV